MSDTRTALLSLSEYVNSLINVGLTPEHLRLAKQDTPDEDVTETLRNTLQILSHCAAREKQGDIDFRNYDALTAVKLHLAFLRYPTIEFYSLSRGRKDCNRNLLIALGWLLGTQNVLTVVLRAKLAGSVLGAECSRAANQPERISARSAPSIVRADDLFADILHLNARVNLNLREINELTRERGSSMSKVHAASINVSGLPHLSVFESALTKRLVTTSDVDGSSGDEDRRREFRQAGILLDTHARWLRKRHTFFDWMITVIQEHGKSTKANPREIDSQELAAFSSLLRQVVKEKLRTLASAETVNDKSRDAVLQLDCPSRARQSNDNETRIWLDDLNERQKREEADLQRNRTQLAEELEKMLKLIPSTIRI